MLKDELKKFYDVLELPPNASLRDVHNSFMRLKKLYSGESIVLEPLGDEFSDKKKKKIIEQIEEAYTKILAARNLELRLTDHLLRHRVPPFAAGFPDACPS